MRILYLADSGSPHTQKWVRHFVQRGDEVHIASLVDTPIDGATLHPLWRPTKTKLDYLANVGFVKKLIKSLQPHILHAHYATSYGLLGAATRFHPYIISTWGMDVLGFPETSPLHKKMLVWSLSKADAVCATSQQLGRATERYMRNGRKAFITPFGIDLENFRAPAKRSQQYLAAGIIKSLEPKYGLEYLMRAFTVVQKKNPNLRLLIVGHGSLHNNLKKLAAELNIAAVTTFVGRVPHQEVPSWFNRIDIFVNPSVHASETFGVAVLEASATEIPVVASNIGGLPEVVQDGVTGFLIPPRNVDALAEKIALLAGDAELRRRMGRAGREFVKKNYDWNENAKVMERLYDMLARK